MSDAGNATGSISCASDDDDDASYNLGYAIASVFVVLLVSFVGFMTPILISDVGSKRGAKLAIVACGMAGTSVIIAVAFHILGDGTTLLLNPCLPESFLDAYPFWGPLFAAITVLLAMLIDYMLQLWLERSAKKLAEEDRSLQDATDGGIPEIRDARRKTSISNSSGAHSDGEDFSWSHDHENDCHDASLIQSKEARLRYKRGIIAFVEISVLTHSIPVGLALGLQRGSAFTGLFIAVIFHQLIEGFGVGAATIEAQYDRLTETMLALAFALTTPIGISIGIILQMTLNTASQGYIITVGTCETVGAGLLLYVGIEHLNALRSRGGRKLWAASPITMTSVVVMIPTPFRFPLLSLFEPRWCKTVVARGGGRRRTVDGGRWTIY